MQVDPCVRFQPGLHVAVFMRVVIVPYHVHRKSFPYFSVDVADPLNELFMPVPSQASPDHLPRQHVLRVELCCVALPLVVICHLLLPTVHHPQRYLLAFHLLYRVLLFHAQHHSVVLLTQYNPTTSTHFSSNNGWFDTLNVFTRCGFYPLSYHIHRSEHRARSRGQRAPGAGRVVVAANTRCLHRCADNSIDQGWVTWRQEWSGWATIPCGVLMMVQVRMFRPSQPRSCCWK